MAYHIATESGISDYYFTSRRRGASCFPHVHSHIEFIYVLDGSLSLRVDEGLCVLKRNTMAVIMPYQIHSYASEGSCDMFIIACPPEYISEYKQLFTGKVFAPFFSGFSALLRHIIIDTSSLRPQDPFRYKALLYHTISEFIVNCSLSKRESLEYDVYRKAIVYISEHYSESLTLESVAFYADVSPVHLSRVLNSRGNSSFSDIVNSIRIFEAKRMLEQSKRPISDIAYETGYGSIRNFNRIFQKYFGCTPRDIRKNRETETPATIVKS